MANDHGGARRGRVSAHATGLSDKDDLVERLSRLARDLQDEDDVEATLQAITHAAVDTIPGAQYAAIALVRYRREVHTRAATAEVARLVDQVQYDTGQGPCLDAIHDQHTVRLSDMRSEARWPLFTERTVQLGVSSMLSFQLFVQRDNLGALSLYATRPGAFTDESEHVGLSFAAHAAVAMAGAQHQAHLTAALSARDVIGQAKGILMERHKLSAERAFSVLTRASQESNTKLVDVARALAETGHIRGARAHGSEH